MVTGGAGFIGSNFIRYVFNRTDFSGRIINVDKLTYAGNPENLTDIERGYGGSRYFFEHRDICDGEGIENILQQFEIDTIVHFAAESHVDRSIVGPAEFIRTNVMGTFCLLEAARSNWKKRRNVLFHHISTDEVYGSLGDDGYFFENTPYDPRSPYSASKASSDHIVRAYYHTYGLPVTISNCSNNYGPFQFPEKLIPLMILNIKEGKPLPIYGDGRNIRDWLYVDDHNSAVWTIIKKGRAGNTYNIGGENEWENIGLVDKLCEIMAELTGRSESSIKSLKKFIKDRPGHDRRYAINCDCLKKELGWRQIENFESGLRKTAQWYLENENWVNHVRQGSYRNWIQQNYDERA